MVAGRHEDDYGRAIRKAARKLCGGRILRDSLPGVRDLHAELQRVAVRHEDGLPAAPVLFDPLYLPESAGDGEASLDRFSVYRGLLLPLEFVTQSRTRHPEGDALYHSLQVYTLARDELPYDEEFQTAALLHDVGKGIDPKDHIGAGLTALAGFITDRTAWLIEHHQAAHQLRDKTLGLRARRRLVHAECFEDLECLADCDRRGRVRGMRVPELEDALDALRDLADNS